MANTRVDVENLIDCVCCMTTHEKMYVGALPRSFVGV